MHKFNIFLLSAIIYERWQFVWMIPGLILMLFFTSCSERIYKSFLREPSHIAADSASSANACKQFLNYAPDADFPKQSPMRYVRVNFHIINNRDSTLNFNLKDGIEYARGLINEANYALSNNRQMILPENNSTPVLPMKYRYIITPDSDSPDDAGVYVHYDEDLAYFNKKGSSTMNMEIFNKYGSRKGEVLNIFLIEHHPDSVKSATYKSSIDGVGFSEWVKIVSSFQHYYRRTYNEDGSVKEVIGPSYQVGAMNHECGHTLGLSHTWKSNDGCDDTPTNPGCWDQFSAPCKESGIYSNNMMDYNNCQCALTPCQLGRIHFNFSKENSSQRKLLLPVWCDYKADSSIIINWPESIVWKSSKDLEGDIIINNGGALTINCEVSLPEGAKIIVKPKGKLILNGAVITNKCGALWQGIETWQTRKKEGEVIFVNNPELKNVKNPVAVRDAEPRQ